MEFGVSYKAEVFYISGPEFEDNADRMGAFLERAREWVDKHGIVLGEGTARFIEGDEEVGGMFQLRAPRVSGPIDVLEKVRP
jgi:hypothetical protein